ncbi:YopX family protein [Bacillus mycoides]|uniref:YopX family protein n=1 Tax=Bacillus mycoides TaxID=1405 RepID=UPI003D64EDCD
MREIKFRGKPIEDYGDTKWFYGNAIVNYEDKLAYIEAPGNGCIPVEWETVGQYTGLKSKKSGKEIYEDDLVEGINYGFNNPKKYIGVVTYVYAEYLVKGVTKNNRVRDELNVTYEVVGNIHDNPELLKGDEE